MRTDVLYTHQPWDIVAHDVYFFYVGRFSGVAVYFFPAMAALALFLFSREKRLYQWLILAIATFGGVLLVVWSPTNYFGGGGTLGNRYFTNLFPLYFFLVSNGTRPLIPLVSSWGAASIFLTSILAGPFEAGRRPGEHATSGVFKWLPPELSAINHLPTNSDPQKFRQRFDESFLGYFLDNTWERRRSRRPRVPREGRRGRAGGANGHRAHPARGAGDERGERGTGERLRARRCEQGAGTGPEEILEVPAGRPFPYEDFGQRTYCYLVTIETETGSIPMLESRGETDWRYLGAFVHIEADPYPGI
jgi:hypothetical protein